MLMLPVKSSNVRAAGYDPATKRMHVQFASGLYEYPNVSQEKFDEFAKTFQADESSTKHLNTHFRVQHAPKRVGS